MGGRGRITRIFEKKKNTAPLLHLYYGAYISCDQQLRTEAKKTDTSHVRKKKKKKKKKRKKKKNHCLRYTQRAVVSKSRKLTGFTI